MKNVWRLYQMHARDYDAARSRHLMERSYLEEIIARVGPDGNVLDLGCGVGEPVARFFMDSGLAVTGVDAAPAMIDICRGRFPDAEWINADMRGLDLGRRFDAVIAWDSFFHLERDEQRAMFPVFARHAAKNGLLLFTSGPTNGEAIGTFHGQELYHSSLDPEEYEQLLDDGGFDVLVHKVEDPDCGWHTVWLARRRD
ncbi:methyltransferase domain-containing protein [Stappia sp. GBMRC 2046]|uniref:Methyltransferase domain-containing protein n=1 Tax=Stappia sediminis TaxID=2692190 RepID=A0A7X3LTD6_9HYPH|nr:class I SAM-dependent methyltransferase [Stappia sediminis]MXN64747.1 methyltransferase domain-containing protein [Stappia sediminis]